MKGERNDGGKKLTAVGGGGATAVIGESRQSGGPTSGDSCCDGEHSVK
ncbi:hypothetical protein M6B38_377535 [Iris pallida]|uniref:Uncharacterized protein n=1 Tax=Iris pallida TaxID=29817 RepID=A0AAX6GAI7_IRIPA|nr:hypothetical protein M6B38_377535 [Iris pallida]